MGTLQVGGTTLGVKNTSTNKIDLSNIEVPDAFGGVTDITSSFTRLTGWTQSGEPDSVFHFNGFVFYNLGASKGSTPGNFENIWQITDSGYIPSQNYHTISSTHQGDTSHNIAIQSNGYIQIVLPSVPSGSDVHHRVIINGWYRI